MRYVYGLAALGLMVVVHELGHLLAAKAMGVRVLGFTIGLGPPVFSFKRRGFRFTLAAIPFGASLNLHGANPNAPGLSPDDPSSYASKPAWRRLAMLVSGSVLNYALAIGSLAVLYASGTHVAVPMTVGAVEPGSEAARVQLRIGDVVQRVDGQPVAQWTTLVAAVSDRPGRPISLTVDRGGQTLELTVVPRSDTHGVGRLGLGQLHHYRELPFSEGIPRAFEAINRLILDGFYTLGRLLRGHRGLLFSTPSTVVKQASASASEGVDSFVRVTVAISTALAVFNLLPVPALDGGRALIVALEAVFRRRLNPRLETVLHALGYLALLGLLTLVAVSELVG